MAAGRPLAGVIDQMGDPVGAPSRRMRTLCGPQSAVAKAITGWLSPAERANPKTDHDPSDAWLVVAIGARAGAMPAPGSGSAHPWYGAGGAKAGPAAQRS
jgi:hypothetical protein